MNGIHDLFEQEIVLLPAALAAGEIESGRLQRVLKQHEAESHAIYAIYPDRRQHLTAAARAFLDFIFDAVPRLSR